MEKKCGWKHAARDAGLLTLRLLMGLTIAHIGYQKVFGGGRAMLEQGLTSMNFPAPVLLSWLAALSEFAGGLCIAFGLGTRIAAFFVAFTMGVAFFIAHAKDPFAMKMPAYLYGSIALSFILTGAGRFSLDSLLCCRKSQTQLEPNQG